MLFSRFIAQKTVLLFCLLLMATTAWAVDPMHIGHVTSIESDVMTRTTAGEKKLTLGEKLYFKQQISTKEKGKVGITFRDGSLFSIAPQSVIVLDKFIFNPAENVSEKSVSLLKGTFRYISGMALKGSKTEVKTPFGTAGVRGSADDFKVTDKGMEVFVGNGEVDIKTNNGKAGKVTAGQLATSSSTEVAKASDEKAEQEVNGFINSLGMPGASPATLSKAMLTEDASANNTTRKKQEQAINAVPTEKGAEVKKAAKVKRAR